MEYNHALALAEQGSDLEAMELLQTLLTHYPFFEPAWQLLAILSYKQRGADVARDVLEKARVAVGESLNLR